MEQKNQILNITNGDVFNQILLSRVDGVAVPFREVMMDGDVISSVFSPEFIALRASILGIDREEYRANMLVFDALNHSDYSELTLWFGKDTFCQMNLLTLLTFLEEINYCGKINLNYIDDESFEVIQENISVELGGYKKIYEEILIDKQNHDTVGVLVPEAIELYFDYHSDQGVLAQMVREHSDMDDMELICLLLRDTKAYGLSDVQAKNLIKRYKKCKNEL